MANELMEGLKLIVSLWDEVYEKTEIILRFIYTSQKDLMDINLIIQELEAKNTATMTPEELQQHCERIEHLRNNREIITNNVVAFKQNIRNSCEVLYKFKESVDIIKNSGVLD